MDEPVVVFDNLPTSIRGMVIQGDDGDPVIVLNSRLSREQNRKSYRHELEHIKRGDMYNPDYIEYGGAP